MIAHDAEEAVSLVQEDLTEWWEDFAKYELEEQELAAWPIAAELSPKLRKARVLHGTWSSTGAGPVPEAIGRWVPPQVDCDGSGAERKHVFKGDITSDGDSICQCGEQTISANVPAPSSPLDHKVYWPGPGVRDESEVK